MNLVKFILYGAIISVILGEFGQYPFGSSYGVHVLDILLALCLLFFITWKVISRSKVYIPKAGYWLIAFEVSALVSLLLSLIWNPLTEVLKASLYLGRFVIYSSVFFIAYNLKKEQLLDFEKLSSQFLRVGIVLAVFGFIQLIIYPDFYPLVQYGYDPHQYRLAATFLDPNFMGAFLCLTVGLLTQKFVNRRNSFTLAAILVLTAAIILTYSRSAYLMFLAFTLYALFILRDQIPKDIKIKGTSLLIISLLAAFLLVPRFYDRIAGGITIDETANARLVSWGNGWEVFRTSPVVGVGFNNFRIAKERLNRIQVFSPDGGHSGSGTDSSLLLVLATTGLIGFVIYLGFWKSAIDSIRLDSTTTKRLIFGLFAALLITSQFNNALFYPAIMLWYFSVLGISVES